MRYKQYSYKQRAYRINTFDLHYALASQYSLKILNTTTEHPVLY